MKKHDLSDDARDILDEIEDMSRCNATNGTTREVIVRPRTGETVTVTLPWAAALVMKPLFGRRQAQWVAQRLFSKHTASTGSKLRRRRARAKPQSSQRWWLLPTYDGDRPADLTDDEYARLTYPGRSQRLETHDAIWDALLARCDVRCDAVLYPSRGIGGGFGTVVRLTHRAVHRALVGKDTRGCKWCEESR